jgi:hypothetical protein
MMGEGVRWGGCRGRKSATGFVDQEITQSPMI